MCEESHFVKAKFVAGSSGIEYGGRRVRFVDCDLPVLFLIALSLEQRNLLIASLLMRNLKNVTFVELSLRVVFYQ